MTNVKELTNRITETAKNILLNDGKASAIVIVRYRNAEIIISANDFMKDRDTKQKLAYFIQFLVLELEDVSSITFMAESWALTGSEAENMEEEISRYGSVSQHPNRKECIHTCTDDGENEYTQNIPFSRQNDTGKPCFVEEPAEFTTPISESQKDQRNLFNGLLSKGLSLVAVMEQAMSMMTDDAEEQQIPSRYQAKQSVVNALCKAMGSEEPKKAFKLARKFAKDIKRSSKISKEKATPKSMDNYFSMQRNAILH